jgi:glycosyltransferase involved in cell wall biosynthesis
VRLLIDLRCLETASAGRGLGRHTRELALALRRIVPSAVRLAGLSFEGTVARELALEDLRYPGPRRGISLADRWLLPRLLEHEEIDLYHAPAYGLPAAGGRGTALVLTVHDLVADLHPELLPLRPRAAFRRAYRTAAVADRVIAISETTRRDLLARYPVAAERVVVVPNGVAAPFAAPAGDGAPSPQDPFLLYVGGLDPSKNVPFLLDVLAEVRRQVPTMRLRLAGETGPRRDALRELARRRELLPAIDFVGYVDDAALAAAYRDAAAFVFPSLYEGFGLPPLEAMAAGCPVVASPRGALPEVLGEAAALCPLGDAAAWARVAVALHRDVAERRRRVDAGRTRAAQFTWERTAHETWEVYRALLEPPGKKEDGPGAPGGFDPVEGAWPRRVR